MVTPHTMKGSTTRPAPPVCCPKTPPCSPAPSRQRDDTFSSLVRLLLCPPLPIQYKMHTFCLSLAISLSHHPNPPLPFHGCPSKARTGALEPSELERFKKQAECLKFPPQYHFGSKGQPAPQLTVLIRCIQFSSPGCCFSPITLLHFRSLSR